MDILTKLYSEEYKQSGKWEFPGIPVVKTPHVHCRGPGINPQLVNKDPTHHVVWPKIIKIISFNKWKEKKKTKTFLKWCAIRTGFPILIFLET